MCDDEIRDGFYLFLKQKPYHKDLVRWSLERSLFNHGVLIRMSGSLAETPSVRRRRLDRFRRKAYQLPTDSISTISSPVGNWIIFCDVQDHSPSRHDDETTGD